MTGNCPNDLETSAEMAAGSATFLRATRRSTPVAHAGGVIRNHRRRRAW